MISRVSSIKRDPATSDGEGHCPYVPPDDQISAARLPTLLLTEVFHLPQSGVNRSGTAPASTPPGGSPFDFLHDQSMFQFEDISAYMDDEDLVPADPGHVSQVRGFELFLAYVLPGCGAGMPFLGSPLHG